MNNDIIELTDDAKNAARDFDEQEAYFLLCEIFSNAQATKDYAKFQTDLNEWKKRFPVEFFSENYKSKIKYMLSKEFLDTVLKNFIAFDELSKKDPVKGLERLRKIFAQAEKHKNVKTLDNDLNNLYKEYPLKFLKEKYPHIVAQILSKANRERVLQKFDSANAFAELDYIVSHTDEYNNAEEFKTAISEWQNLFPIEDFNPDYQDRAKKMLDENLNEHRLAELFPILNLDDGTVIPLELQPDLQNISILEKGALHDFFKIVDRNKGDINSLFDWICKYHRYINVFDVNTKNTIIENLMTRYGYELPPVSTKYQIPKMNSGADELISLSDFNSMNNTKKDVVIQLLGILSTGAELSSEDIYRLNVIDSNAQKVKVIDKAKIEPKLDLFMEKFPEDKLTPNDEIYLEPILDINSDTEFKDSIKIEKTVDKIEEPLEKGTFTSTNSGTSDNGGNSGGWSSSLGNPESTIESVVLESSLEETETNETEHEPETTTEPEPAEKVNLIRNFFNHFIKHNDTSNDIERDDR